MRMSAMIKIENVSKVYGKGKKNQVQALKSIDLELEQGHNYAIIGKSGSGKSTLMNMIGLLDLPTEGKIFFKGSDISHYNAGQQAKYRNMEVGFVYQDFRLIDELTAKENILLPRLIAKKKIDAVLNALELSDYRERHPASLSGGQKQRVTIGVAIVKDSLVIYFDEPTSGLDYDSMVRVSKLIEQLSDSGVIVFVVSHDFEFIVRTCTEVVQLDDDGTIQNQQLSPTVLKSLSEKYFT